MAPKGIALGALSIVLVLMFLNGTTAESDCTNAVMGLYTCIDYITGSASTPTSTCCSQISNIVQSKPKCICILLNGGSSLSLGINMNKTIVSSLNGACNVQIPSVSSCDAGNDSADSPMSPTPLSSPTDSSDTKFGALNTLSMPSAPEAATGESKTIPTAEVDTADANFTRMQLYLTLFAISLLQLLEPYQILKFFSSHLSSI